MTTRRDILKAAGALTLVPLGPLGAATQVAGVQRRGVGGATVTALLDGFIELDPASLNGADEETRAALLARSFLANGPVETAINAYVVEAGGRTVVVDSGAGAAFGPTAGGFAAVLAAAGVDPAAVDAVMLTHLHPDHCNGVAPDGAALFPNAELIVHAADHAFWTDDANFAGAGEMAQNFAKMAQAAVAPYADRLTLAQDGHAVAPGLTLMHMPGHTPGHSGLMVSDGDANLLIWGDIVHVGPIQFARPEVTIPFDVDQPLAAGTRARVMDMAATDELEIAGSHIVFPSFGRLTRDGQGYAFHPSRWDFAL